MFIQPARDPENPGKRYGGRNISMGGAKLVAKGQPVEQPVEVNRIRLGANLTRPVPPGVYRGELQFYMGPQGGVPVPGPSVQYSIEVKGYVELDVNPGPLEFVALAPGDVLSKNTVQIKAETNRRDMELQIALSPLQNVMDDGQVVPQSITSLGVSPQPRQAWRQAEHGRLGSYMLQVPLEPGKNTLHVAGRIRISLDIPAGEYRGNLNVTAQPAWR